MRVITFVFLIFFLSSFVFAEVLVQDYDLQEEYLKFDDLQGNINLTIDDLSLDSQITSNQGESAPLEDFLEANFASYSCNPLDCLAGYSSISNLNSLAISLDGNKSAYFGFYIEGQDVFITDLDMKVSSDFGEGKELPLEFIFFEDGLWRFAEFSDSFGERNWGCYDSTKGSVGNVKIKTGTYCETVDLESSAVVRLGVQVTGDNKDLRMSIYPEDGSLELGTCTFNPGENAFCTVYFEDDEVLEKGIYHICVGKAKGDLGTDYKIYEENEGDTCGFVFDYGPGSSVKDYALFVQTANYESASYIDEGKMLLDDRAYEADGYLQSKYGGDCSDGCYLPIEVSGKAQSLVISDAVLGVSVSGENLEIYDLHRLSSKPATIDFSGDLDLGHLGFKIQRSGLFESYLDGETLFSEEVRVLPSPIIDSVNPMRPAAGVLVNFVARVNYSGDSRLLEYDWDFGDGGMDFSKNNSAKYSYYEIGNYTLILTVSVGDISVEREFEIETIPPGEAIDELIKEKKDVLTKVQNRIEALPALYRSEIEYLVGVDYYIQEVERLESEREGAASDEILLYVLEDLYALEIPENLFFEKDLEFKLADSQYLIDPEPLLEHEGITTTRGESYSEQIINWQKSNIEYAISKDSIYLSSSGGSEEELLTVYSVDLFSKDETLEGYLIIDASLDEIVFDGSVATDSGDGITIIPLEKGGQISMSFYLENTSDITLFASPNLSRLVIEEDIDYSCNYNKVCEAENEDWRSCRSDCFPLIPVIYMGIGALVFVVLIFFLLHLWYKHRYESHLFGDKRQLYNLLMFIANARARGMGEGKIVSELQRQGWSGERINYAMKKSKGKIKNPVKGDPLVSQKRDPLVSQKGNSGVPPQRNPVKIGERASPQTSPQNRIATGSQQQNKGNINKSGYRK